MAERPFNYKKPIILTKTQEKIIILMCEDRSYEWIAKRLGITLNSLFKTLKQAQLANKIRTNYGLLVRYIGNGYLDDYDI